MSQDSGSKSKPPQRKGGKSPHSLEATPTLKLVVSNPAPSRKKTTSPKPPRPTEGFSVELHSKGEHVYQLVAQDPSHYLACDLKLEVIEGDDYGIGVICHFPDIVDEDFDEFVKGDVILYGNLMGQFHIKIMEALLLFCGDYDASGLVIYVNDDQAKQLGAYGSILVHQEQVIFKNIGEKTAMIFRVDQEIFDKWIDFMEDITHHFHQELWLEQRTNPLIRAYLKSNALINS